MSNKEAEKEEMKDEAHDVQDQEQEVEVERRGGRTIRRPCENHFEGKRLLQHIYSQYLLLRTS